MTLDKRWENTAAEIARKIAAYEPGLDPPPSSRLMAALHNEYAEGRKDGERAALGAQPATSSEFARGVRAAASIVRGSSRELRDNLAVRLESGPTTSSGFGPWEAEAAATYDALADEIEALAAETLAGPAGDLRTLATAALEAAFSAGGNADGRCEFERSPQIAEFFARIAADAKEREASERDAALGAAVRAIVEGGAVMEVFTCNGAFEIRDDDGHEIVRATLDEAVQALAARLAADTETRDD